MRRPRAKRRSLYFPPVRRQALRWQKSKHASMFEAFVVALREGSELALILLILSELLLRAGCRDMLGWVAAGTAGGLALSGFGWISIATLELGARVEAALLLAMAIVLTAMSLGSMASADAIRRRGAQLIERSLERRAAGSFIAAFVAFATAREAAELIAFAHSIGSRFGAFELAAGMALGLAACALLCAAGWRSLRLRKGMLWAFRLSAAYLLVMSASMAIEGGALLLMSGFEPGEEGLLPRLAEALQRGGEYHALGQAAFLLLALGLYLRGWWRSAAAGSSRR